MDSTEETLSPNDFIVPLDASLLRQQTSIFVDEDDEPIGLPQNGNAMTLKSGSALKCRFCNFTARFASWVCNEVYFCERSFSYSYIEPFINIFTLSRLVI